MLNPVAMLDKAAIGNDAGWALTFHAEKLEPGATGLTGLLMPSLSISRDDYYATVEATMPGDFAAGKYKITIEGLIDEHYAKIVQKEGNPTVVRLHLYWRDTNASPAGYLANLAGLTDLVGGLDEAALKSARVAELAITKVTRTAGPRRYDTVIEAGELPFVRLAKRRFATEAKYDHYLDAAKALMKPDALRLKEYGFNKDGTLPPATGDAPGNEQISFKTGMSYAAAMKQIAKAVSQATRKYGRGMLLIRDGELQLGPRPIPPENRPVKELSFTNGLLKAEKGKAEQPAKPDAKPPEDEPLPSQKPRDQFDLTLKGRPDVKPGDVVSFHPAKEDLATTTQTNPLAAVAAGFLGSLVRDESTEPKVTLYVNSVEHKLGRTSGFSTKVTGLVVAEDMSNVWEDKPPLDAETDAGGTGAKGATASSPVNAARAIRALAEQVAAVVSQPEVGEVRAATTKGTGKTEPPAQTEEVWRGLAPPDGFGHGARRLPVRRKEPAPLAGVTYASPFAWGRCGLVLPRYPGTRVLLVHRNGEAADPVEVGAVWESGHAPETEPGDYWLILPAGIPAADRASVAPSETPPKEHTGPATNDLIDADGNRVIEVGELTVRVGRGKLKNAGERPARGSATDGITIEHSEGGAKIEIASDGKITIHAKKNLELISDADITMKAKNVDVAVDSAMNVH